MVLDGVAVIVSVLLDDVMMIYRCAGRQRSMFSVNLGVPSLGQPRQEF